MTDRSGGGAALWWAAMQEAPGLGPAAMLRLARLFGSAERAVKASPEELTARAGISEAQAQRVAEAAANLDMLRRRLSRLSQHGIAICSLEDPGYPRPLLDLRSPPPLLYLKGEVQAGDARAVAVVGTREPDQAGRRLARRIAQGLAERGYTIVSGLARGIDTAAHRGALAAKNGRTIAIVGCGLLRLYPPENSMLAARIARRGCLLSEVPPETEVDRRLLLARDRLQAALSRAVIVVQAHAECGSIVTARYARRCGRLLYGVPWPVSPFREGWERLRQLGAEGLSEDADLDELSARIDRGPEQDPQRCLI